MSMFDLAASLEKARRRLGDVPRASRRRPRSDRGRSRLDPRVRGWLEVALSGQERPPMAEVLARVGDRCRRARLKPPSRATVYKLLETLPTPTYRLSELPPPVRDALYNLTPETEVPAHQIAFYCFDYGDLAAVSFAGGLPWLALYQAARMPGHRARSRGLIEAAMRARGIV